MSGYSSAREKQQSAEEKKIQHRIYEQRRKSKWRNALNELKNLLPHLKGFPPPSPRTTIFAAKIPA